MILLKERLADVFDTYEQDVTSHDYCLKEIKLTAAEMGLDNPRLDQKLAEAAKVVAEAVTLDRQWEGQKMLDKRRRPKATKLDNQLDPALSSLHTVVEGHAKNPVENEHQKAGKTLLETYFPAGVYPITSQRHERQHALVADLTEAMRRDHPDEVALLGLGAHLDGVDEINAAFGEALSLENSKHLSFDKVREARAAANDAFYKVIAVIMGDYVDDPDTRNALLEPFADQQQRVAAYQRNRGGNPPAVDPNSGDFTDGPTLDGADDTDHTDEPVDTDVDVDVDQPEPV